MNESEVIDGTWIPNSTQSYEIDWSVGVYMRIENEQNYITTEDQFAKIAANATRALLAPPFYDRDPDWFNGVTNDDLYPIVLQRTKEAVQAEINKERACKAAHPDQLAASMNTLFMAIVSSTRRS